MIDIYSQVFTEIYETVESEFEETVKVENEYPNALPGTMPAVTLSEIRNTVVRGLLDSSEREKYSRIRYRVRVFTNDASKRMSHARKIFYVVDQKMFELGFRRQTYAATPSAYNSTAYGIQADYESVVDENGVLYRNQ